VKAFVITLRGNEYSERSAARCIESAAGNGVEVSIFEAVPAEQSLAVMHAHALIWTWPQDAVQWCVKTGLRKHPYGGRLEPRIGCAMSHYLLWQKCVLFDEPLLILEHDAVFIGPLPEFEFDGACQINDPRGATPRGDYWSDEMAKRGPGVWPKTKIFSDTRPDGLAGNSAYLIKPGAAQHLITKCHQVGLWPNDAIMCRQLVSCLQELYPFVTRVEQTESTTR